MKNASALTLFKLTVTICLFVLAGVIFFLAYQQKQSLGETYCDVGSIAKDERDPFEFNGNVSINEIGIKAGTGCTVFTADGSDGCYTVTGMGTSQVQVIRIGVGPVCKEISHVAFFNKPATPTPSMPPATPTSPPSPTRTPSGVPTSTRSPSPTRTISGNTSPTPSGSISSSPTPPTGGSGTPGPTNTPPPGSTLTPTSLTPTDITSSDGTPTATPSITAGNIGGEDISSNTGDTAGFDASTTPAMLPVAGDLKSVAAIAIPVVVVLAGLLF